MAPAYESSELRIRPARPSDLAGIGVIRNDAIEHSRALWTTEPWTDADAQAWFAELDDGPRFAVVAVRDVGGEDDVLGYASCAPWRTKTGYRHTLEDSVYVRPDAQGAGLGRLLVGTLIETARGRGAHLIVADIESGNTASIALHERFGFVTGGTFTQIGTKFGEWLDLTIMTLRLDERAPDPA